MNGIASLSQKLDHLDSGGMDIPGVGEIVDLFKSVTEDVLNKEEKIAFNKLIIFFEKASLTQIDEFFQEPERITDILSPFLDFLRQEFFSQKKPIPEKVMRSIQNDPVVCSGIFDYIKERNPDIISIQDVEQYDIIAFHLSLLGMSEDFNLTKDIQFDNLRGIKQFLVKVLMDISEFAAIPIRNYADIGDNLSDEFIRVLRIGETINILALIHSGNFEERQISLELDQIIRTNIDAFLQKMGSEFTKKHIVGKKLNNLCGQMQVNFGHAIPIDGKTVLEIKRQVKQGLEKIQEGYERQVESEFGGELSRWEEFAKIKGANEALLKLIGFEKIQEIEGKLSEEDRIEKKESIERLIDIYGFAVEGKFGTIDQIFEHVCMKGIENDFQIEALYYLILHIDIEESVLEKLLMFFLSNDKQINNYLHTQFAIKIIAQIVRKFHMTDDFSRFLPSVEKIRVFLEKKDISPHVVLSYSKIYLSLALFYIKSSSKEDLEKAQIFFLHYRNLITNTNKNSYKEDEKYFYRILGEKKELEQFGTNIHSPGTLEKSGEFLIKQFMRNHQQMAILSIEGEMGKITAFMNHESLGYSQEQVYNILGKEISKSIFYNLCTIVVIGDCQYCASRNELCNPVVSSDNNECFLVPEKRGFQKKEMLIAQGVSIVFTYSSISEKIFDKIFAEYESIIQERFGNLLGMHRKNTFLEKSQEEIERIAFYDALTGLSNNNKLKKDIEEMERDGKNPTVIFIEVPDYSLVINTIGGEDIWNDRMKQALDILQSYVFNGKIYRKDESIFAIVSHEGENVIQAFIDSLPKGSLSFCIGMTKGEYRNILSKTGMALSKARRIRMKRGDLSMGIFEIRDQNELDEANKNTDILRQALDENNDKVRIVPYYQPICDVNGNIYKYESLARIELERDDGETTIVQPGKFIHIAEANGWSPDITGIMLMQNKKDLENNPNISLSSNVNAQDWDSDSIGQIFSDFSSQGLSKRITLEILETVHIDNKEDHIDNKEDIVKISNLRELGFLLAIDDFGTGESNGFRVAQVKPEFLKIDKVIVLMLTNEKTREDGIKLIEEAVSIAQKFDSKTVAEFVMNEEIFEILKQCGVNYFQGEYFGMAEPLKRN